MNDVVPMAEERPYPHQQGTWTLTAPDGRQWQAESPLQCCGKENAERIPAQLRLQRIFNGMNAWTEQGIWLMTEGNHVIVRIERDGKWIEVIREYVGAVPPVSHIVEPTGIETKLRLFR